LNSDKLKQYQNVFIIKYERVKFADSFNFNLNAAGEGLISEQDMFTCLTAFFHLGKLHQKNKLF